MNNKKTNIMYEQYKVLTKNNDTEALKYITLLMDVNKKLSYITQMTLKYANSQTETSIMYMQQKK